MMISKCWNYPPPSFACTPPVKHFHLQIQQTQKSRDIIIIMDIQQTNMHLNEGDFFFFENVNSSNTLHSFIKAHHHLLHHHNQRFLWSTKKNDWAEAHHTDAESTQPIICIKRQLKSICEESEVNERLEKITQAVAQGQNLWVPSSIDFHYNLWRWFQKSNKKLSLITRTKWKNKKREQMPSHLKYMKCTYMY